MGKLRCDSKEEYGSMKSSMLYTVGCFLLGVGLTALAQTRSASQTANSAPLVSTATANQRYQIVINPNVRAAAFLLDTATGQIWVRTQYTDLVGIPPRGFIKHV
jgi:hypothetical protein